MTGILVAALVLAWAAIAMLALGYSSLTMQLRGLHSRGGAGVGDPHPELAAPGAGRRTLTLAVTDGCESCVEVFAAWVELSPALRAAGHRTVVLSLDGSTHWRVGPEEEFFLTDQLSSPFLLAYQPALLVLDETGALVSADPIGSAAGLHEAVSTMVDAYAPSGPSHDG
ncbi:MAG TPA: hypothetical protein VF755_21510 [Catenuloplanes sp.]